MGPFPHGRGEEWPGVEMQASHQGGLRLLVLTDPAGLYRLGDLLEHDAEKTVERLRAVLVDAKLRPADLSVRVDHAN